MNLAAKKWVFIKISSVILLPLMFWFIINFVNIYDNDYLDVVTRYSKIIKLAKAELPDEIKQGICYYLH